MGSSQRLSRSCLWASTSIPTRDCSATCGLCGPRWGSRCRSGGCGDRRGAEFVIDDGVDESREYCLEGCCERLS